MDGIGDAGRAAPGRGGERRKLNEVAGEILHAEEALNGPLSPANP